MINFLFLILAVIFISMVFKAGRFFGKMENHLEPAKKDRNPVESNNAGMQKKNKTTIEEAEFEEIN